MESKNQILGVIKLKKMLADAKKRNEDIIIKLYCDILPLIDVSGMTQQKFDLIVFNKINDLADSATSLLKKRHQTIAEQEIYCISLLAFCFFDRLVQVTIDNKKVKIIDKRP